MLASRVVTLPHEVREWPPCLRICGLPPQSAMEALSPELRTLFVDSLLDMMTAVLVARLDAENQINVIFDRKFRPTGSYPYGELYGPLPRDLASPPLVVSDPSRTVWKWELSFKEDLVRWLAQLQWTTRGHVTFVELALDYEATIMRAIPAAPASRLCAQVLSLPERARVLRVAMTVLSKHVVSGVLYRGGMT